MDGVVTALADNLMAIFGDFSNYVIADRIGMTVDFIAHLFDPTTGRPTGQRGWFAYYRVGADSVNDAAFRVLNVT
jgi:HK97 family phage major capsid protein